jgi:hypothetical protein
MALLIFHTKPSQVRAHISVMPLASRALTDMKHQKMLVGVGILLLKMPYPGWRKSSTSGYRTLSIHYKFLSPMLYVLQGLHLITKTIQIIKTNKPYNKLTLGCQKFQNNKLKCQTRKLKLN